MSTPTLDTMASEQVNVHFRQVEERLLHDYTAIDPAHVHTLVEEERSRFAGARVHAFIPILVERAVRATLTDPPAKHRR